MSDIFGRSTITPTDVITKKQISSMIRNYVTSRLNLVDVDPGEIVVFGDKQGKLKTSNLSLDDLLTKPKDAADNSIAVFKSGKLEPSYDIKTLDKIVELETDLEAHMKDYKQFRRNVISKFFGTPLVITPSLAEIKKSIDDNASAIKDIKTITDADLINTIKNSIDDIKKDITNIKVVTNKVKIPHDADDVEGLSYVVIKKFDEEYLQSSPAKNSRPFIWTRNKRINGIYRFSLISEHQFNIKIRYNKDIKLIVSQGVNVVLFKYDNEGYNYEITPVDSTVVRATYGYIVEYLSPI